MPRRRTTPLLAGALTLVTGSALLGLAPAVDAALPADLQSAGGDVIISFGGAEGGELAQTCTSVSDLTAAYANIVNTYGVTRLDFDIEGSTLDDSASNQRRNQALAALQQQNPAVQVDYTLGVSPNVGQNDANTLENFAASNGVQLLAFWEVSHYDQATGYAYSKIFNQITG